MRHQVTHRTILLPVLSNASCFTETENRVYLLAVHGARQEEVIDHRLTDREWAEEWKHLDNVRMSVAAMLNLTSESHWKKKIGGQQVIRFSLRATDDMSMTVTGTVKDSLHPI